MIPFGGHGSVTSVYLAIFRVCGKQVVSFIFDNVFSVVSLTVVLYDWGESCNAYEKNLDVLTTPALTFGREVG
jgi:hypothetical protein